MHTVGNGARLLVAFPMVAASTGKPTEVVFAVQRPNGSFLTGRASDVMDEGTWTNVAAWPDDMTAVAVALGNAGWNGAALERIRRDEDSAWREQRDAEIASGRIRELYEPRP